MDNYDELIMLMAEMVEQISGEEDSDDSDPAEVAVVLPIRGSHTSTQMSLELQE